MTKFPKKQRPSVYLKRPEAAITKWLDKVDRRVIRIECDVGISIETLAIFMRFLAQHDTGSA